jgi:hypothetical protein
MNVDVEIYMSNLIKFFKSNPKDLYNLVPQNKEEEFYSKIKETAIKNSEKGDEVSITRNQMIEICKELNNYQKKPLFVLDGIFYKSDEYGTIGLN